MSVFPSNSKIAVGLATLAALSALAGCSRSPLTAPLGAVAPPPHAVAPPPPTRLATQGNLTAAQTSTDSSTATVNWMTVSSVLLVPGIDSVVAASRYQLRFAKGSLAAPVVITIQEYDKDVVDVMFGPHGTRFATPVELSIDFSGTACDPGKNYSESLQPVLYYLNETTNNWEEVPGVTDWVHLRHIVHLEHFSRYVLGGKAGWRHTPPREDGN